MAMTARLRKGSLISEERVSEERALRRSHGGL